MNFGRIALKTITMNYVVARVFISLTIYSTIAINDTSFMKTSVVVLIIQPKRTLFNLWICCFRTPIMDESPEVHIRIMKREWSCILLSSKSDNGF